MSDYAVVDVFAGVGALTHGFFLEGFNVTAGIDADESCRYAYETNNPGAQLICKEVQDVTADEVSDLYPDDSRKILVGCAPCQPYSQYTKKKEDKQAKWKLIPRFSELISEVLPDIVSMENVPDLVSYRDGKVYRGFVEDLKRQAYHVTEYPHIYCPDYGVPQERIRLVLFASRHGPIEILPPTHLPDEYVTVEDALGDLEPLKAGEAAAGDPIHKAASLSRTNLKRIQASEPGGTWRDWPTELRTKCHSKESGQGYVSVYGRMSWKSLAPTITTQAYNYGSGRFGHPEQDRAVSLREAALLQTFPVDYEFVAPDAAVYLTVVGRHIGNAVPVALARIIARSIKVHLDAEAASD